MTRNLDGLKKGLTGMLPGFLAWVVVALLLEGTPQGRTWVVRMERMFSDSIQRQGGGSYEREDLVLLGVDEPSLTLDALDPGVVAAHPALSLMQGNPPWDRRVWAQAIDRLADAGAKAIVLDFIFSSPTTAEADESLAAAIARHRDKVVLVSAFSMTGQNSGVTLTEPYDPFLGENYDTRVGYANFPVDPLDGMCRVARYTTTLGREDGAPKPDEPEFRSLAAEIIDLMGGTVPDGERLLRFASEGAAGGQEIYAPLSFYTIFDEAQWRANYDEGRFFKDKIVMIGPVAPRFQDIKATPVGTLTGPQLHLQAVACGLDGRFLWPVGMSFPLLLGGGLVALLVVVGVRHLLRAFAGLFALAVGWMMVAKMLQQSQGWLITVTTWCVGLLVVGVAGQVWRWVMERRARQRLAGEFRRFVSRDVADRLVADPDRWHEIAAGRQRRVVVLFSDVRGFTSRSEGADAASLVAQLNEYLSAMVAVVFRNGGTLDKFIGDALMVHWGALEDGEERDFARAAVKTAVEMIDELAALNASWIARGMEPLHIGIGIHAGEVTAGEIGCPERTEFGVLGDAVNLASRIEGLTKTFAAHTAVSAAVSVHAPEQKWIALGPVRVKGRSAPVELHALGDESSIQRALAALPVDEAGVRTMDSK